MAGSFLPRKWSRTIDPDDLPATKRISTPAGMRLSVIMNNSDSKSLQSSRGSHVPPQLPIMRETTFGFVSEAADVESLPKEPDSAKTTSTPRAYSPSITSEKKPVEGKGPTRRKRGALGSASKRKCMVMLGVVSILLLALIIGLAAGLTLKKSRYDLINDSNV
jgi:hypothetical protein